MLIKILLFITLFFKFTVAHAHSENKLPNFITVKNYFNTLDNVRIYFRQCNENEKKIKHCNQGNMYITRNFENKSKTRIRIDYENPNSSIIMDKDNIMYCDHDLEETSYFSEDILFFKLLTADDNKLQKYFIANQSDDKNFVFLDLMRQVEPPHRTHLEMVIMPRSTMRAVVPQVGALAG